MDHGCLSQAISGLERFLTWGSSIPTAGLFNTCSLAALRSKRPTHGRQSTRHKAAKQERKRLQGQGQHGQARGGVWDLEKKERDRGQGLRNFGLGCACWLGKSHSPVRKCRKVGVLEQGRIALNWALTPPRAKKQSRDILSSSNCSRLAFAPRQACQPGGRFRLGQPFLRPVPPFRATSVH